MSYWRCDNGHCFKLNRLIDKHLKLRNIDSPDCTICGSSEVHHIDKQKWMRYTGRLQRKQPVKKKTLRNKYMER